MIHLTFLVIIKSNVLFGSLNIILFKYILHEVTISQSRSEPNIFGGLVPQRQSGENRPQPGNFALNNMVQATFEGNAFDA